MSVASARELFPSAPCACCGVYGHNTVDHLIPRALGGTSDPLNLQPLCYRCQVTKSELEMVYAVRFWHARSDAGAALVVRQFLRFWRPWCADRGHHAGLECRCGACMTREIVFGGKAGA